MYEAGGGGMGGAGGGRLTGSSGLTGLTGFSGLSGLGGSSYSTSMLGSTYSPFSYTSGAMTTKVHVHSCNMVLCVALKLHFLIKTAVCMYILLLSSH